MKIVKLKKNSRPTKSERETIKQARRERKNARGRQWVASA